MSKSPMAQDVKEQLALLLARGYVDTFEEHGKDRAFMTVPTNLGG